MKQGTKIKRTTIYRCILCGHEWTPRINNPIACPNCKRYDWKRIFR